MTNLLQMLGGLAMIAGLLAVQLLVLHLIARLVLIAVSFVPLIGKRHRHAQWGSLNAAGSGTRGPRRMDGRREQRAPRWLADLLQDLRFGARTLRRAPLVTAAALLTLTLAIGATTAIFSLIDPLLFRDVPIRDPASLVQFTFQYPGDPPQNAFSRAVYERYRDGNHVFSDLFGLAPLGRGRARPKNRSPPMW